jgi:hypothetical protein
VKSRAAGKPDGCIDDDNAEEPLDRASMYLFEAGPA